MGTTCEPRDSTKFSQDTLSLPSSFAINIEQCRNRPFHSFHLHSEGVGDDRFAVVTSSTLGEDFAGGLYGRSAPVTFQFLPVFRSGLTDSFPQVRLRRRPFHIPKKVMQHVDENAFVILGRTHTGNYEPVKEIADLLDEYENRPESPFRKSSSLLSSLA